MCSRTDQTKHIEENPTSKVSGRIFDPEVKFGDIWEFPSSPHRAGWHRPPASDRGCFWTGLGGPEAWTQSHSHPRSTGLKLGAGESGFWQKARYPSP